MAYIRKRTLPSGKIRFQLVWNVGAKRLSEMFETARQAKEKKIAVEGSKPSSTALFRALATDYLAYFDTLVQAGERERAYYDSLKGQVNRYILADAEFADLRCCNIGTPEVQLFFNRLVAKISAQYTVRVRGTLSQIFKFGTQTGYASSNPVRDTEVKRKSRPEIEAPFTLPTKAQLKDLVAGAKTFDNTGRASAAVHILMYGGLRMSEFRGLARPNCRLIGTEPALDIVQRADRYNAIGSVKSAAGRRTVDLGPDTAQMIRIWLMAAPKAPAGDDGKPAPEYAFPNADGGVWQYNNIRARFWVPLMNHCGLITNEPASKHIQEHVAAWANFSAPLFSPHTLRHVYASLQIEQGVTPKRLQKLLGHSTLKMTLDTYGHLWPDEDADRQRARGVEKIL